MEKVVERKKQEQKRMGEEYIQKEICRGRTWVLINRGTILKTKKCRICGSKENIEIHHDVYPTKDEEIIEAVKKRKIYFLCNNHHLEKTNEQRIKKPEKKFVSLKIEIETLEKFKQAKRLREIKEEGGFTMSEFLEIMLENEFRKYDGKTIKKLVE